MKEIEMKNEPTPACGLGYNCPGLPIEEGQDVYSDSGESQDKLYIHTAKDLLEDAPEIKGKYNMY